MKKIKYLFLLLITFVVCSVSLKGYAMPDYSKGDFAGATSIKAGTVYTASRADTDSNVYCLYTFTTTQPGYVTFMTINPQNQRNWGYSVKIYNSTMENIYTVDDSLQSVTSPDYSYAPGTYYIAIGLSDRNSSISFKMDFVASNYWEKEGNDDNTNSNVISVNTVYYGEMQKSDDVDYYKVTTPSNGYVRLDFTVDFNKVNRDMIKDGWKISIMDQTGESLFIKTGVKSSISSHELPFASKTFYIKIENDWTYSPAVGCPYSFKMTYVKDAYWEKESNDDNVYANKISTGKNYYGNLYLDSDVDYFSASNSTKGYYQVKFNVPTTNNFDNLGYGWNVTIKSSNGTTLATYKGIKSSFTSEPFPYSGKLLVCVEANWRYGAPVGCTYILNVNRVASNVWEKEINDTKGKATSVAINNTNKGVLSSGSDADWFKFDVKSKGKYYFSFSKDSSVNNDNLGYGWNVYIYSSKDKLIKEFTNVKTSKATANIKLSKGKYYVKVTANYTYGAPVGCIYNVMLNNGKTPSKTSFSKVSYSKGAVTLQWKSSKNANQYIIQRSTKKSGGYKTLTTIKDGGTLKFVDTKSLKKGKTYYYKIIAVNKGKATKKSSASSAKSVKIK